MFNYRSMSDVELLNAYREILVAKRRQILWRAMENHNAAEKKIPNPGADHEKLAVLSSGSSCCTELHDIQIKIAALDAAVIEEEKRLQGMTEQEPHDPEKLQNFWTRSCGRKSRGEIAAQVEGISLPGATALCEGNHTAVSAAHLFCGSYGSEEDAT